MFPERVVKRGNGFSSFFILNRDGKSNTNLYSVRKRTLKTENEHLNKLAEIVLKKNAKICRK